MINDFKRMYMTGIFQGNCCFEIDLENDYFRLLGRILYRFGESLKKVLERINFYERTPEEITRKEKARD